MKTTRMPTLFFGHGSPMNAITQNAFADFLNEKGRQLIKPKAILAISAHWESLGTQILKSAHPKTIHDFGGFPSKLFEVQYQAPGDIELADKIAKLLSSHHAKVTDQWGLDHGTWSVLVHLYPQANIPVLQLSLDRNLKLRDHFNLAKDLKSLRDEGVLILGSGNITHNLRAIKWNENAKPFDWAIEFDQMIKTAILKKDYQILFNENPSDGALWDQALPTLEHYIPLLYVLGASDENDQLSFPYEEIQMGSLSMRSVEANPRPASSRKPS